MSEIDHDAAKQFAVERENEAHMPRTSNLARAYLDSQRQLAAERARVVALCDVIYDANGIAYPFKEMQDKMTAILNAQGD